MLVLRDRDTVAGLAARLRHARRVAIVGNGGIALELVHALRGVEASPGIAAGSPCMLSLRVCMLCKFFSHAMRYTACVAHCLACVQLNKYTVTCQC